MVSRTKVGRGTSKSSGPSLGPKCGELGLDELLEPMDQDILEVILDQTKSRKTS